MPAPGGSVEASVLYIPSPEAQAAIDFTQVRILAFVQNQATQLVYQSHKAPPTFTDSIHAASDRSPNASIAASARSCIASAFA